MKKPVALIFGHRGGIGSAAKSAFLKAGYRIIPVDRTIIDFDRPDADAQINSLLTNGQPDVVVNAAGVFRNGWQQDHVETMNVNVGSNWSILRHYMNPSNQTKSTRIIMIGSSSHSGGRSLYPLYSASKAAVYNLWQSASQVLADTDVAVDLVNPVRTLTRMSTDGGKKINPALDYLKPEQVAERIMQLVNENLPSRCIEMTYEDVK
jgi:NAD(P)-dependent dehydrogenase (short-subunit alcohol dehydrogenase family)